MTKEEAIIISAYTGYLLTKDFEAVHEFCEKLLKRPIYSHEFADDSLHREIQERCKPLIFKIVENEVDDNV